VELSPNCALLVIDLQIGTTSAASAHPITQVISVATDLATRFRAARCRVVLTVFAGTPAGRTTYADAGSEWPEQSRALVPALRDFGADLVLERRALSAFADLRLHDYLQGEAVSEIVLAGVATSFGIESTARQAYDLGYDVVVATDAITDRSKALHDHSVTTILPVLARLAAAQDLSIATGAPD
jgi:nicotinamidase-related amidase